MAVPFLDAVTDFCDDTEEHFHDQGILFYFLSNKIKKSMIVCKFSGLPTKHNLECGQRSVWSVIKYLILIFILIQISFFKKLYGLSVHSFFGTLYHLDNQALIQQRLKLTFNSSGRVLTSLVAIMNQVSHDLEFYTKLSYMYLLITTQ